MLTIHLGTFCPAFLKGKYGFVNFNSSIFHVTFFDLAAQLVQIISYQIIGLVPRCLEKSLMELVRVDK